MCSSYSTQRWNAHVAGNSDKKYKTGKMKHAYNKGKPRSIILKMFTFHKRLPIKSSGHERL